MKKISDGFDPVSFTGLTVFLPAVSETESFMQTFNAVCESCDPADIAEIILIIYKKATPECLAVAEKIASAKTGFPIIKYVDNGNVEQTVKTTISMASGSHFIYQPTDLEEDPGELGSFIKASKAQPGSIITASRLLTEHGIKECALLKRILNVPFNTLLNILYRVKMTDATLLYSLVPTKYAQALNLNISSYSILFEMMLKLIRLGVNVDEIPVEYHKREQGKSNVKLIPEGMRYLKTLVAVRFDSRDNFIDKTKTEK